MKLLIILSLLSSAALIGTPPRAQASVLSETLKDIDRKRRRAMGDIAKLPGEILKAGGNTAKAAAQAPGNIAEGTKKIPGQTSALSKSMGKTINDTAINMSDAIADVFGAGKQRDKDRAQHKRDLAEQANRAAKEMQNQAESFKGQKEANLIIQIETTRGYLLSLEAVRINLESNITFFGQALEIFEANELKSDVISDLVASQFEDIQRSLEVLEKYHEIGGSTLAELQKTVNRFSEQLTMIPSFVGPDEAGELIDKTLYFGELSMEILSHIQAKMKTQLESLEAQIQPQNKEE